MFSFGGTHVKYGGLVIAGIGFILTRYTVAESARFSGPFTEFVAAKGLFLLLGLSITVVGIGLAVSTHDEAYVSMVAWWTVVGVGAMGFVVGITTFTSPGPLTSRESHLVANVLLGSTAGGLLTGFYSASRNHQRQLLRSQANRLTTLNRILRHEVLNKVNVIQGYVGVAADGGGSERVKPLAVIERNTISIDNAIEQVGALTRTEHNETAENQVEIEGLVRRTVEASREQYPAATIEFDATDDVDTVAYADNTVEIIVVHLLDNAIEHTSRDESSVGVTVDADETTVEVCVTDDGPGLPESQRELLVEGDVPEYDDPTAGFGLAIVRHLTDRLDGTISVDTSAEGTTVSVSFPRVKVRQHVGIEPTTLARVAMISLVPGALMGVVLQTLSGQIGVIGSLYGVASLPVGWSTHLFHSVVFGLAFVAIRTHPQATITRRDRSHTVASGAVFGLLLWVVAAGLVMPLWLRLIGIEAPLPDFDAVGFLGHLTWGVTLGLGVDALEQ